MKTKVSRKELTRYYNCIGVGYCALQSLLNYFSPQYYNSGVYGWNFDAYTFGDVAIITGYRNVPNFADYQIVQKYEKMAENLQKQNYEIRRSEAERLLNEFIREVTA